jgi:hypothetical protein
MLRTDHPFPPPCNISDPSDAVILSTPLCPPCGFPASSCAVQHSGEGHHTFVPLCDTVCTQAQAGAIEAVTATFG